MLTSFRHLFICPCIIIFLKIWTVSFSFVCLWHSMYAVIYLHHKWEPSAARLCTDRNEPCTFSNQTFAAASPLRDNDSVNSYDAGSRYLSSSLAFLTNVSANKLDLFAIYFMIRTEWVRRCMIYVSLIIKNKIRYYCYELYGFDLFDFVYSFFLTC